MRTEDALKVALSALHEIEQWGPFPNVEDHDGRRVSYGVAYGSNGERDYMRRVARRAIELIGGDA